MSFESQLKMKLLFFSSEIPVFMQVRKRLIVTTFHFFGGFWRLAIYGCTCDLIENIAYITVTGCCNLVFHCASYVTANSASLTACRLIVVVVVVIAYDQSQDVLHMLVPRFRRRVNTLSHWPSWSSICNYYICARQAVSSYSLNYSNSMNLYIYRSRVKGSQLPF